MRHRVKGRKLNRTASHRLATLKALATALIRHKKIKTTLAKAKETRTFVEPLITKAKTDSVHNKRQISDLIKDRTVVSELFNEIAPKVADRPGGYTRVVKLGRRLGDAAEMAIIELVDYNDLASKKSKKTAAPKAEQKAEVVEEKDDNVEDAVVVEETTEEKAETKEEVKAEKAEDTTEESKDEEKK